MRGHGQRIPPVEHLLTAQTTCRCKKPCSEQRPQTSSGTCTHTELVGTGCHTLSCLGYAYEARLMQSSLGYSAPLDGVVLSDTVLHADTRLRAPPPRHAVALAIQDHVEVHSCTRSQILSYHAISHQGPSQGVSRPCLQTNGKSQVQTNHGCKSRVATSQTHAARGNSNVALGQESRRLRQLAHRRCQSTGRI